MSYPFTGHACELPWKMCSYHSALKKHCWGWSNGSRWHCRYQRIKRRPRRSGEGREERGEEIADKMADGAIARPVAEKTRRRRGPPFREIQYLPPKDLAPRPLLLTSYIDDFKDGIHILCTIFLMNKCLPISGGWIDVLNEHGSSIVGTGEFSSNI